MSDVERRTEMIQVRLSPSEKQAIARCAESDGKSIVEWVREDLRIQAEYWFDDMGEPVPFHGKRIHSRTGDGT